MAIMGIDIGGSGIKGVPVDVQTGKLLGERFRLPTPEKAKPEDVAVTVGEVVQHFQWNGPIGIGFPAALRNGIALTAANIHNSWIGTDANALFSEATGCPVYVLNDADAAGMAEMQFGVGADPKRRKGLVILITIGTGLGTALFIDGTLVPNTELGHIEIRGKDAERRASDAARQKKDMGWEEWGRKFNEYLSWLERLFWPDLFVLGGGISKQSNLFLPYLTVKTDVVPAVLLNQAGIVGAALYAAQKSQSE